jgi:large subunit ribosomal protein L7/L12
MAKAYEKMVEEIASMSVMDLAELVKAIEAKFGVSAAMPAAVAASAGAAPEAAQESAEKTEYKVTLKDGGPEKIKTIKALRQVTTLGLTEAKKAVEEAPTVIAEAAAKDKAKEMKQVLEAAGAKVELA